MQFRYKDIKQMKISNEKVLRCILFCIFFSYEFEWKTPMACLPHYNVECTLFLNENNEDEMYDLSVLSKWDNNMRAQIDVDRVIYPVNRKIFINVCRNIVKKNGAEECPSESGICMIRGTQR